MTAPHGVTAKSAAPEDRARPSTALSPGPRSKIGIVIAASLAAGLLAAVLLPFLPFVPPPAVDHDFATAMVLLGFAVGWALLAVLSRRTDQPQRWAVVPAVFMGSSAVLVLVLPDDWVDALGWVWPPALLALVVWMFGRAWRDLHSRARAWLLYPVLAALLVVSLGGAYETVGRSTAARPVVGGRLVDVGPYRLHLQCFGTGTPTVVIEPGGGASAATLGWITPAVARETRVCVYDRAGRGWSDPAAIPPDGAQVAADLHTLLDNARVPGPYVLAGHSFGGLYVQAFAARYPHQVAGLVLVDSTAPGSGPVPPPPSDSYSVVKRVSALLSTTARVGLPRLLTGMSPSDLPQQSQAELQATASTPEEVAGVIEEYAVAGRSTRAAGQLTSLDGKPLVVLTADLGTAPGWGEDQDAMARLSTNSRHDVVDGATHATLVEDPEHAAEVSQAIVDVVESVRTSTPLPR